VASILANTITTFKHSRKCDWVRKFLSEKLSYIIVFGFEVILIIVSIKLVNLTASETSIKRLRFGTDAASKCAVFRVPKGRAPICALISKSVPRGRSIKCPQNFVIITNN
jgi:hypothetical protein